MKHAFIQWDEVRRRLRASEAALEQTWADSPERVKTIFRQRAVRLGRIETADHSATKGTPALIFRVGQERYAVALGELAEVMPFRGCTPIPGTPQSLLGVINLRGELRPVINLAHVLSGGPSTDAGAVLVLRRQGALKVDAVEDLRELSTQETAHPVQGSFILTFASGTLGLLDVEAMLSTVFSSKGSRSL